MSESSAAGEMAPKPARLFPSPGGLLLFVCLFLPAVKGCDHPVYPREIPLVWGPYLFGLLVAVLAVIGVGQRARLAHFLTWILATAAALQEQYFFVGGLLDKQNAPPHVLWPLALLWFPPAAALAASVRRRDDLPRWRAELLWNGGSLCFMFFLYFVIQGHVYYGMWLSLIASAMLIAEGAMLRRPRAAD